jgi:hypothetical protein
MAETTNRRLKKIERIVKVQERLRQLAEWDLARLDRTRAELRNGEESLLGALNDEFLHGLFVEAMARRLKAIAAETERLNRARDRQMQRLVEESLKLKRTERMSERIRREQERQFWKRAFDEMLDTIDDGSAPGSPDGN